MLYYPNLRHVFFWSLARFNLKVDQYSENQGADLVVSSAVSSSRCLVCLSVRQTPSLRLAFIILPCCPVALLPCCRTQNGWPLSPLLMTPCHPVSSYSTYVSSIPQPPCGTCECNLHSLNPPIPITFAPPALLDSILQVSHPKLAAAANPCPY